MCLTFRWSVCLLFLFVGSAASAQNPDDIIATGTSFHIYAQPGEPTVEVFVLGQTASGVYVVGESTNLLELLALTGAGATVVDDEQYERDATVRLMREQGGTRAVVYEKPFESFLAEPATYPTLQDGDIFAVEVNQRRKIGLRDYLQYASSLASITLLILRITGS